MSLNFNNNQLNLKEKIDSIIEIEIKFQKNGIYKIKNIELTFI